MAGAVRGTNPAWSRHSLRRASPRRTHDLTVPSGCREMVRDLGVGQALVERQRDRLLLAAFERVDAVAHRLRLGGREQHLDGRSALGRQVDFGVIVVIARQRHGVGLAPAQAVEAAIADDAREPGLGLALRGA